MKITFMSLVIMLGVLALAPVTKADNHGGIAGKFLLQVENNGEAWYVNPMDMKRYYLGRPNDAFNLFASIASAVANEVAATIPEAKSIVDVAAGAGKFNTLVAAVQAAGLAETLDQGGPFTVFAPIKV